MNTIVGLGNAGSNVIKHLAQSMEWNDVKLYSIDSVLSNTVSLDLITSITTIPIVSDEKVGSGRNRERGKEMYKLHESNGDFNEMYNNCDISKSPVIVISSAAGGTGSGAIVPFCEHLVSNGIFVIPIIIIPALEDPIAYQLNANDLMMELDNIGIETYSVFRNIANSADYDKLNAEVCDMISIILGKKYPQTELDSIDESDLDTILHTPGRFVALSDKAPTTETLSKSITKKCFTGYQPGWGLDQAKSCTLMTAYSLTSMFAKTEFSRVFSDINKRIVNVYDEYRNIKEIPDMQNVEATLIVAGLPAVETRNIDANYNITSGMSSGIKSTSRPSFIRSNNLIKQQKPVSDKKSDDETINKFKWK